MKKFNFLLIIIPFLQLISCAEPDCIYNGGEEIGIGFYDLETGAKNSIRINSLILNDSVIGKDIQSIQIIQVPINPAESSIELYFDTEFGNDTLLINYRGAARLISEDCGSEVVFKDINIGKSDFDSIRVINKSAEINFKSPDAIIENIQVFN